MHSIERYGIVALLFLVVTVVAVLMWDGGKGKKKEGSPGGATVQAAAAHPRDDLRPDPRDAASRRLSLVAESQPGPLVRQPNRRANAQDRAQDGQVQLDGGAPLPEAENIAPLTRAPAADEQAPPTVTPREEPAREPVVGRATPPAASSSSTHAYVVRSGDTLSEIAQHELGSAKRWQEIVAANPGLDPGRLKVGKSIQVPGAQLTANASAPASRPASSSSSSTAKAKVTAPAGQKTWTVGKGENLWKIAERALGDGKRWKEIAALNPRTNPDRLVLGQVLTLPGSASANGTSGSKKTATKPRAEAERATLVASTSPSSSRAGRVR